MSIPGVGSLDQRAKGFKEEIAAKSFGDFYDVAAMAKFFYVFLQNDFHE